MFNSIYSFFSNDEEIVRNDEKDVIDDPYKDIPRNCRVSDEIWNKIKIIMDKHDFDKKISGYQQSVKKDPLQIKFVPKIYRDKDLFILAFENCTNNEDFRTIYKNVKMNTGKKFNMCDYIKTNPQQITFNFCKYVLQNDGYVFKYICKYNHRIKFSPEQINELHQIATKSNPSIKKNFYCKYDLN